MIPTETTDRYWIGCNPDNFVSTKKSGKWCIWAKSKEINDLWTKVQEEVKKGTFACAKTSTNLQSRDWNYKYVICIYTSDWEDSKEVLRVLSSIRNLGVTSEVKFKRDADTMSGKNRFVYKDSGNNE